MSQCKHGAVIWADCVKCKGERIAELEAKNAKLEAAIDEMLNCTSKDAEGLVKAVGVLAVKSGYFDRKALLEAGDE
jgi:hypothetical protein